jgi:hypothetical protein
MELTKSETEGRRRGGRV